MTDDTSLGSQSSRLNMEHFLQVQVLRLPEFCLPSKRMLCALDVRLHPSSPVEEALDDR